jgi:hypothetical protein
MRDPESDYVTHLRDAARRDREAELWVAVDDDGTLLGRRPVPGLRSASSRPGGEFRMLAVDPPRRARVGKALVTHVVDRFRRKARAPS